MQLLPVVQRAVQLDAAISEDRSAFGARMRVLVDLPAVQQIPADALPALLRAAIASNDCYSVSQFSSCQPFAR
jgi:hypothetical protein